MLHRHVRRWGEELDRSAELESARTVCCVARRDLLAGLDVGQATSRNMVKSLPLRSPRAKGEAPREGLTRLARGFRHGPDIGFVRSSRR